MSLHCNSMMQSHLKSSLANLIIAKFGFPIIVAPVPLLLIFSANITRWGALVMSVVLLAAAFMASLAILEISSGALRYKRFFRWKGIEEGDIVRSGCLWPPFIGYIKLTRFVFPWGRIYFALDGNLQSNPFRRGQYPLLLYLQQKSELALRDRAESKGPTRPGALVAAACVGALFSGFCLLLQTPRPIRLPDRASGELAVLLVKSMRVYATVTGNFLFNLIVMAGLGFMAIRRLRSRTAWIYAFLSGAWTVWLVRYLFVAAHQ